MEDLWQHSATIASERARVAKNEEKALAVQIRNLQKKVKRRVELDFTKHEMETALMLYDRSGFRLTTPVRYMREILNRRQAGAGDGWTHQQLSTLVLHWWDRTSGYHQQTLAMECMAGHSKRAKKVQSQLELAELTDWIGQANRDRGIAPTRQDVITQYAVVKMLNLDDEPTLQTVGQQDPRRHGNRSFWRRCARA